MSGPVKLYFFDLSMYDLSRFTYIKNNALRYANSTKLILRKTNWKKKTVVSLGLANELNKRGFALNSQSRVKEFPEVIYDRYAIEKR